MVCCPGIGDLVSPLFAIGVLWQAHDLGIPRIVQLRMIFNVAIDALLGVLPFIGDLFDFVWKANDKNMVLLEHHASAGTSGRLPVTGCSSRC